MSRARRYAEDTTVPVTRSRHEIDNFLFKQQARQRVISEDEDRHLAIVMFSLVGRQFRIEMPLPDPKEVPSDKQREQITRARWRCMLLLIKAKFEQVASGNSTVEREFLADLVLPDGARVHDVLVNMLESAYLTGTTPPLLLPR